MKFVQTADTWRETLELRDCSTWNVVDNSAAVQLPRRSEIVDNIVDNSNRPARPLFGQYGLT